MEHVEVALELKGWFKSACWPLRGFDQGTLHIYAGAVTEGKLVGTTTITCPAVKDQSNDQSGIGVEIEN